MHPKRARQLDRNQAKARPATNTLLHPCSADLNHASVHKAIYVSSHNCKILDASMILLTKPTSASLAKAPSFPFFPFFPFFARLVTSRVDFHPYPLSRAQPCRFDATTPLKIFINTAKQDEIIPLSTNSSLGGTCFRSVSFFLHNLKSIERSLRNNPKNQRRRRRRKQTSILHNNPLHPPHHRLHHPPLSPNFQRRRLSRQLRRHNRTIHRPPLPITRPRSLFHRRSQHPSSSSQLLPLLLLYTFPRSPRWNECPGTSSHRRLIHQ